MYLKLIMDNNGSYIYLSPATIKKYGITSEKVTLHFGAWKTDRLVTVAASMPQDTIGLSKGLTQKFTLPEELAYQIYIKGNHVYLGPVIAFIAFQNHDKMTLDNLTKDFKVYFTNYDDVKGLVCICAKDTIDTANKVIKGYYYVPNNTKNNSPWKPGIFPYPNAVYNRAIISKEIYNDLRLTIGDKIFNTYSNSSFDKWELWKLLSSSPNLKDHTPQTAKLDGPKTLNNMLSLYQAVYFKPAVSTYSKGIIKVRKAKKGYIFIYPKKQKKAPAKIKRFINAVGALELINSLKSKNYIVQQAIKMKRYNKRGIDFRVIMQKNGDNQWNCMGVFAKFGKKKAIITNFKQAGFLLSGQSAFKKAFKMNKRQAFNKISELQNIAFNICKVFDSYGNYGDLGIDLMVDKKEKVWVLEVNTVDPYHKFPLFLNDQKTYKKIVANPLEYAKFLTGFENVSD